MKYAFRKFLCLSLTALALHSCAQTNTSLSPDEFEKQLNADSIQILDVRTPGEYNSGHIKKALQADWNDQTEFSRRIAYVDMAKPVYIYCLAGGRSAAAADKMRKMGYANVYELKGGINAWKAANKPLEGKTVAKQMSLEEFNNAIAGSKTVLVDFGAAWCPPCKLMEPVLKNLQTNKKLQFSLTKVDGGNDEEIMKTYKVTALPVFIIFKNGNEVWRKDGVVSEEELAAAIIKD